jgi:hypothetical protein
MRPTWHLMILEGRLAPSTESDHATVQAALQHDTWR